MAEWYPPYVGDIRNKVAHKWGQPDDRCGIAKEIPAEYRIGFTSLEAALKDGYDRGDCAPPE